jgi:hypothetical protein
LRAALAQEQSSFPFAELKLDCFAEFIIGRRFGADPLARNDDAPSGESITREAS